MNRDVASLGVAGLAAALQDKAISSVEATQALLERAKADTCGAFLALDAEGALAAAHAADARRARGDAGPLVGIPIAHKDIFVTEGLPTTAGSRMLEHYRSPFDATVVARLKAAGAVSLGKLNCDEFAMGSANENSAFRPVLNPWDPARVPGGSSGGSAAAVAAGLVAAATGTDTGGSIRQPASFTGVTGIKPTYGVCSRYGMIAFASSLDQAGVVARSAEDCALMLSAMSGFDERDATSVQRPPQDFHAQMRTPRPGPPDGRPLQGLRIGLPREFFPAALAADVGGAVRAALAEMERLGASLVDVSLPRTELSIPVYYIIAPAEASSNLGRYDGVRYGHRAARYADLGDMYRKTRSEAFGPEVKRRIMIGTYVLSHGYYDAYYLQAQKLRRMIAEDFQACFRACDLLAGPVAPTVAWKLGEQGDDPVKAYLADIFTLPGSLAGLPGMSVPAGFGEGGMPVGLQLLGNYFDEGRLLHAAHAFQQATDFHLRRPRSAAPAAESPARMNAPAGPEALAEASPLVHEGDCLEVLPRLEAASVDLVVTSPPYADQRASTYGGVRPDDYVDWFLPRAAELHRVLRPTGSFVLNIKEKVVDGERHTYVLELILALRRQGWLWTEEYVWHKRNCFPGKWPNRFRDAWERCLHFTRQRRFKMNQDAVRVPMGDWAQSRLRSLGANDVVRHDSQVGNAFAKNIANWVGRDLAYPTNVLHLATECGNKDHSAAYPSALPQWFITLFTDPGDVVLDPFVGSGTTLEAARQLGRRGIGIDISSEFVEKCRARLSSPPDLFSDNPSQRP